MTATLERIKTQIRELPSADLDELLQDLQQEYRLPSHFATDEGEDEIEAAWEVECQRRMAEIEAGTAILVGPEEYEQRITAIFAKHGLQRRSA